MSKFANTKDTELLCYLQSGDTMAYTEIYNRYFNALYHCARKIADSDDDAKDIIQEIFLYLWLKGACLEISGSLSAYLRAAVHYKTRDFIDKKNVRSRPFIKNYYKPSAGRLPDEQLFEKELNCHIQQEIHRLPAKMQEVFILSRNTDLTHKCIGQQLNISEKTVKKQVSNALKILRGRLKFLRK